MTLSVTSTEVSKSRKHSTLADMSEQLGATSIRKLTHVCRKIAYIEFLWPISTPHCGKLNFQEHNMPLERSAKCKV